MHLVTVRRGDYGRVLLDLEIARMLLIHLRQIDKDFPEMLAHGRLAQICIPRGDGVDDLGVLIKELAQAETAERLGSGRDPSGT